MVNNFPVIVIEHVNQIFLSMSSIGNLMTRCKTGWLVSTWFVYNLYTLDYLDQSVLFASQ